MSTQNAAHTPGPWEAIGGNIYRVANIGFDLPVAMVGVPKKGGAAEVEELAANARLIAEAGTIATETGLTPRQLAEQRAELLEALRDLLKAAPNETDMQRLLQFSGLDDVHELRIKAQNFGHLSERARAAIAKATGDTK